MISDPLDLALREVAETKHLLEALISSSDALDYFRAKATLEELRTKVRVLGKLQAKFSAQRSAPLEQIIHFSAPGRW